MDNTLRYGKNQFCVRGGGDPTSSSPVRGFMFLPFSPADSGPVGSKSEMGIPDPSPTLLRPKFYPLVVSFFLLCEFAEILTSELTPKYMFYLFTLDPTKVIFFGVNRCTPRLPLSKWVLYLYLFLCIFFVFVLFCICSLSDLVFY